VRIQLLYFAGCPHYAPTLELLRRTAAERGQELNVELIEVRNNEDARRLRFLGSPTLRVNGVDIEPTAVTRNDFALACRVYGASGTPSRELIEAALTRGNGS